MCFFQKGTRDDKQKSWGSDFLHNHIYIIIYNYIHIYIYGLGYIWNKLDPHELSGGLTRYRMKKSNVIDL